MTISRLDLPAFSRTARRPKPPPATHTNRNQLRRLHQLLAATLLLDALDFSITLWNHFK